MADTPSSAYPDLERKPGISNWVDRAGGLPDYIERIAKHIHYEHAHSISTAIAAAVNTVKRWCHGGTVSKTGGPEVSMHVSPATRTKACAALAEWNAKRGAAALHAGLDRDAYSDLDLALEIEKQMLEALELGQQQLDQGQYDIYLAAERAKLGLDINDIENGTYPTVADVEYPQAPTASTIGRFIDGHGALRPGQEVDLGDGYKAIQDQHEPWIFALLGPDGQLCGIGSGFEIANEFMHHQNALGTT